MTELHDLLDYDYDYDNDYEHRFAEHARKRRTSTSGC